MAEARHEMAQVPIEKARLSRFSGQSVANFIDLVHRTSRLVTEPADINVFLAEHRPAIIAVWHGQFLLAPKIKPPDVPLAVMLARHGDAELMAQALARFNTTLIRGAGAGTRRKDRGGAAALRGALRALQDDIFVGMTADVPPGPARRAGEGIVALARLSGRPIIPLAAATSRFIPLKTWSRMTINLPFGKLSGVFGDPIYVQRDADPHELEIARQAVERGLDEVTRRAYRLVGTSPRRATPPEAFQRAGWRHAGSLSPGIGLRSYELATRLMEPAAPFFLGQREQRGKEDKARRAERLGRPSEQRPTGQLVWIHAASVGELSAVLPLSMALRAARPNLKLLFTTGTTTSAGLAARRLPEGDIHQYVPLDSPRYVNRFLDHWRPDLAVLTESEIWPNFILAISARAIPLALVNARMSDRSFSRWRRLSRVAKSLFSRFDVVIAQSERLAERYQELGGTRCLAAGNLKIDAPPLPFHEAEFTRLKQTLSGRPTLVAASTHDGEERVIAAAHKRLARDRPGFCTILAPRHPERGPDIVRLLGSYGLRVEQRSRLVLPDARTDIYLVDTIGELGTVYPLSPIAFVGGSLVDRGGQNPIEAIRSGAVVLSGPHWENFADAYGMLHVRKAALVVSNADELAAAVSRLLSDEMELRRMQAGAQMALASLSGALELTVDELLRFLPDDKGMRRAG